MNFEIKVTINFFSVTSLYLKIQILSFSELPETKFYCEVKSHNYLDSFILLFRGRNKISYLKME